MQGKGFECTYTGKKYGFSPDGLKTTGFINKEMIFNYNSEILFIKEQPTLKSKSRMVLYDRRKSVFFTGISAFKSRPL